MSTFNRREKKLVIFIESIAETTMIGREKLES